MARRRLQAGAALSRKGFDDVFASTQRRPCLLLHARRAGAHDPRPATCGPLLRARSGNCAQGARAPAPRPAHPYRAGNRCAVCQKAGYCRAHIRWRCRYHVVHGAARLGVHGEARLGPAAGCRYCGRCPPRGLGGPDRGHDGGRDGGPCPRYGWGPRGGPPRPGPPPLPPGQAARAIPLARARRGCGLRNWRGSTLGT
jgi:hypothetical protein